MERKKVRGVEMWIVRKIMKGMRRNRSHLYYDLNSTFIPLYNNY